jgi:uroporphyrinogen decarboxylase
MPMPEKQSKPKNSKANLIEVLQHKSTCQPPWVPFAGVHVGKLKGYSAREVLQDADKLFDSLLESNLLYAPDGQPVVFDLQIEAEILGCELLWAEDSPPTVATHPLQTDYLIPTYLPTPQDGRLPIVLDVMRRMKAAVGEHTALYGLITGPFTLASHLRGTEIFMDMMDDPEYVSDLLEYCTRFVEKVSSFYIEAGMDIIAVVDPMISQISPRHFKRFMSEPFSQLFSAIREQKVFSAFFVCGDATKNLDGMCQTNPDCIAVDENIDMVFAQSVLKPFNITLQGNIPLTSCMLLGTQEDNMQYVINLLDSLDHHNLIISPGCDMPYDTPVENVIGVAEAIGNPEQTRNILSNYQHADLDLSQVVLPDYQNLVRPLMEVFTLDSASCAACSYMLLAAERATEALQGKIDMVEYKMTSTDNIARLKKMGIQNLPSILINGELRFSSLIPGQKELIETIQEYFDNK